MPDLKVPRVGLCEGWLVGETNQNGIPFWLFYLLLLLLLSPTPMLPYDRFRGNEHGVLVASDVAARGLDIPVRTSTHSDPLW